MAAGRGPRWGLVALVRDFVPLLQVDHWLQLPVFPPLSPALSLHVVPNEHCRWISIPLRRRSVMELVIRRVGL